MFVEGFEGEGFLDEVEFVGVVESGDDFVVVVVVYEEDVYIGMDFVEELECFFVGELGYGYIE